MSIDTIIIEWHIDDVRGESRYVLTDAQCREVLRNAIDNYDCNYGINWAIIHFYADDVGIRDNAPLKQVVDDEYAD